MIAIPRERATGAKVGERCRRHGIIETIFDRWRRKYGGLQVKAAKRLKQLEEETGSSSG